MIPQNVLILNHLEACSIGTLMKGLHVKFKTSRGSCLELEIYSFTKKEALGLITQSI